MPLKVGTACRFKTKSRPTTSPHLPLWSVLHWPLNKPAQLPQADQEPKRKMHRPLNLSWMVVSNPYQNPPGGSRLLYWSKSRPLIYRLPIDNRCLLAPTESWIAIVRCRHLNCALQVQLGHFGNFWRAVLVRPQLVML